MKKWIGAAVLLLLLLVVFSVVLAQTGQFDLPWHSIDSGGGTSSGGDFTLRADIGQPDAGSLSGGDFAMSGGFLVAPISPGAGSMDVYLPLLRG
jgi:hypothetical protein